MAKICAGCGKKISGSNAYRVDDADDYVHPTVC